MAHPTPDELLHDDATSVASHLAACEACRRLRELLRPASAAAASGEGELPELRLVDPTNYALHEELRGGVGGMGRIVRATDRRLGRAVAIKQPLTDGEPTLAELLRVKFEAEARLTARLEHPAIVTVYEAGRWPDGEPFYAMRLVRGAPLGRVIEQCRDLADRLALVGEIVKVGEALAYAHAQGVIHRDVKPDNILVGPYGQTVLIDWGLARDVETADELPATPAPPGVTALGIGTAHYMPPEQAQGKPPDERLDVYALGATLYHVLAGEPPYAGGAATARATLIEQPASRLADRVEGLPPALVACVERAMARDPAQRFASMAAFVAELQRFQRGELLQSYRYGTVERLVRFVRKHRAVFSVAIVAVVVLAIVVVKSVWQIVDERDQKAEAQLRAEAALADSRGRTASLLALRSATRADALIAALDGATTHGESPVVLQGLIDAIAAGPVTRRVDAHAGGELPAVELPGDRFATVGIDRKLRVWHVAGSTPVEIDIPVDRTHAAFARGPHVLACGFQGEAAWIDVDRRTAIRLPTPGGQVACTITPDGEPVTGGAVSVIRWTTRGAIAATLAVDAPIDALAIDATGAVLATTGRGDLWRWTPSGASHANGHTATTFGLIPFGDGALTAGFDGRIVQWSISGGVPTPVATLYEEPGAQLGAIVPLDRGTSPTRLAITAQNTPDTRVLVRDGDRFRLGWRVPGRVVADGRDRVFVVEDERVVEAAAITGAAIRVLGDKELAKPAVAVLGTRLAVGSRGGHMALWAIDADPSHASEVVGLVTMEDGTLASAGLDGRLVVHDPKRADALLAIDGAEVLVVRTAGSRLLAYDTVGGATVVDATGGVVGRVTGKPGLDATLSLDGATVAIAGVDGVELLPLRGGQPVVLDANAATAVAFDGDAVVTGHLGGSLRRWTPAGERTAERSLASDAAIGIRAIAPFAGGVLATLRDRTVLLDAKLDIRADWPLELVGTPGATAWIGTRGSRAQLVPASGPPRDLVAHSAVLTAGALRGDELAATGDQAGEVVVWNARTGTIALRIHPLPDAPAITALAFTAADELVIGDARGAIRRIPLTLARATALACARLARIGRATETAHCR